MLRRASLLALLFCLCATGCRDDNIPPPDGFVFPSMDAEAGTDAALEAGPG